MAARPKSLLGAVLCALICVALAATPAHATELAPAEPHSPNAEAMRTAYWVTVAIAVALAIAVQAALIVATVRFRERRGREPRRFSAGRGALRPVIGALGLLAVAVFVVGVVLTGDARQIEPSGPSGLGGSQTAQVGVKGLPAAQLLEGEQSATGAEPTGGQEPAETSPLEIDAIAQQWVWRFEYPGGQPGQRTFSYGELVVPVDTAVVLNIRSTDVVHSWWVPSLGGQVQAPPADSTQTWFKADEEGRYAGRSTIFSGTAYPTMRAWVRVVSVPEYEAYVSQLSREIEAAQGFIRKRQEEERTLSEEAQGQ